MQRLLSYCPIYSIFCCCKRVVHDEDQQAIADQLEIQQQPQLHEIQAESSTVAIIMPMQEAQHQEFQSSSDRVAWTADRMLKRHTRRRASHSPAQLNQMCINVEVHHSPETEIETGTETEIPHLAMPIGMQMEMELEPDPSFEKPIAQGVEFFSADTEAILQLDPAETDRGTDTDTDTGKHHQML